MKIKDVIKEINENEKTTQYMIEELNYKIKNEDFEESIKILECIQKNKERKSFLLNKEVE